MPALLGSGVSLSVSVLLAGLVFGVPSVQELGARGIALCHLGIFDLSYSLLTATTAACRALSAALSSFAQTLILPQLSALLQACRHLCTQISILVRFVAASAACAARAICYTAATAARIASYPLAAVWRSPAASLIACAVVAIGVQRLHAAGVWVRVADATAQSPAAAAAAATYISQVAFSYVYTCSAVTLSKVGALIASIGRPAVLVAMRLGSSALLASRTALSSQLDGLSFTVATVGELHARPAFGLLVWLLAAGLVRAANGAVVPPRALAASQLALSLLYWSNAARLLPVVLVLAAGENPLMVTLRSSPVPTRHRPTLTPP